MARVLKPITIRGVRYTVMRLDLSARGPRLLLRDDQGRIFGAWQGGGSVYRAQLLEPCAPSYNPLEDFVFNDSGDSLTMRRSPGDSPSRSGTPSQNRRYPRRG